MRSLQTVILDVADAPPLTVTPSKTTLLGVVQEGGVESTWLLSLKVLWLTTPDAPRMMVMPFGAIAGVVLGAHGPDCRIVDAEGEVAVEPMPVS